MGRVGTCCKYFCPVFVVCLATLLQPLLLHPPMLVKIDDIKEWGLKGPGVATLPSNMLGVYYLDGNQAPWGIGACNKTEASQNDICRNGYKRSNIMVFDSSHMSYDRSRGLLTTLPSGWGLSEHAKHKGGVKAAAILQLMRAHYTFDKKDREFAALAGKRDDYFEGAMKLYVGYFKLGKLVGADYRVTAEDTYGDGSVRPRPRTAPPARRTRRAGRGARPPGSSTRSSRGAARRWPS